MLLAWALPTWLYRLSLKSTAWLYLPILLTRVPARLRDGAARQDFIARQNRTWWERIGILAALIALLYALVFAIDWGQLGDLAEVRTGETPLTPYHVLLVLDLGRLPWWNWVSVPAALLTVVLFFWIDWVRKTGVEPMGAQVTVLLITMNVRNWLAYAWCLVALYAFVGDAWALCRLPQDWAPLVWLYGPVSCEPGV